MFLQLVPLVPDVPDVPLVKEDGPVFLIVYYTNL